MMNHRTSPEPLADAIGAAAVRMGISRSSAYNLVAAGKLTALKMGRRTLILRSEQERFLAALPVKDAPQAKAAVAGIVAA